VRLDRRSPGRTRIVDAVLRALNRNIRGFGSLQFFEEQVGFVEIGPGLVLAAIGLLLVALGLGNELLKRSLDVGRNVM
jgi:hypothetical protein